MTKISNQYSLTNVLTADVVNGRVGVNNTSPTVALDVTGAGKFSADLTISDYLNVKKNGSDTAFSGAYLAVSNAANNVSWAWQLGASNKLSLWLYNGGPTSNPLNITTAGNVGIGTSSPTAITGFTSLTLNNSTNGGIIDFQTNGTGVGRIINDSSSFNLLSLGASSVLILGTNGSEKMRITSGGNVGIGTGAPLYKTHIVNGGGNAFLGISNQGVSNGDRQIRIGFGGGGSDTFAQIQGTRYNIADDINISMQAGGGNVYIGLTSSGSNKFAVSAGGVTSDLYINSSGGVGSFTFGTGPVYASGGILTMTNPSDKRLKKDIKEISYGLSDILKLKPVSYNWLNDSINQGIQFGFIAQEVQEIMPDAIKEFGDDIKYLGLEKDAIYVTLVKAIQELSADLTSAKQEIELLKAK
jgi:hypothetical protein